MIVLYVCTFEAAAIRGLRAKLTQITRRAILLYIVARPPERKEKPRERCNDVGNRMHLGWIAIAR